MLSALHMGVLLGYLGGFVGGVLGLVLFYKICVQILYHFWWSEHIFSILFIYIHINIQVLEKHLRLCYLHILCSNILLVWSISIPCTVPEKSKNTQIKTSLWHWGSARFRRLCLRLFISGLGSVRSLDLKYL